MTKDIATGRKTDTSIVALEMTNPLSSRALFWQSRYLTRSDFLCHLPFAFWLADVVRPSAVVELGVSDGQSYFAFCQAVDRLNLPARCYGAFIPDPEGDEAPTSIKPRIEAYNEENYAEFSRLLTRPAAAALDRFEDGSIDLLILNMTQPAECLEQVIETGSRKLSGRSVLLLRDFPEGEDGAAAYALLRKLKAAHANAFLEDGSGLAVILYGDEQPDRLRQFAGLQIGTPEYQNTHLVFRRLGIGHFHEWSNRVNAHDRQRDRQAIAALDAELAELRDKLAAAEARRREDDRRIARIDARAAEMPREYARHEDLASARAEAAELRSKLAALERPRGQTLENELKRAQAARDQDALNHLNEVRTLKAQIKALQEAAQDAPIAPPATADQPQIEAASEQQAEACRQEIQTLENKLREQAEANQQNVQALNAESEKQAAKHREEMQKLKDKLRKQTEANQQNVQALNAESEKQAANHREEMQKLTDRNRTRIETRQREARELENRLRKEIQTLTSRLQAEARNLATHRAEAAREIETLRASHSRELAASQSEAHHAGQVRQVQLRLQQMQARRQARGTPGPLSRTGRAERREIKAVSESALFDAEWYMNTYPDVREAGMGAAEHFVTNGLYEGRHPGPDLDTVEYYIRHPEALDAGLNPVLHTAQKGRVQDGGAQDDEA